MSWYDCQEFIDKLNSRSDQKFRLPTEAEWEYAARSGGKEQKYAGGDDVDEVAWYYDNSGGHTHEVGIKSPNDLGIYDMSGNVFEWCLDVYDHKAYSKHSRNNPVIISGGYCRVNRGGCWDYKSRHVRSVFRSRKGPGYTDDGIGFRPVRSQEKKLQYNGQLQYESAPVIR